MSEEDRLKTNNEKVTINDYYYYYLLKCENALNELEKWLKKEHENGYEVYYLMAIQDILDKLKALKENNNNG